MLHLDIIGSKKRKRLCGRVFRFKNFGEPGYPVEFSGSFRENVKELLGFGHMEGTLYKGMPIWSFQLEVHRHPPLHILLFVIEEPIEASPNPHCKHCQYSHTMYGVFHSNGFGHLLCVNGLEMGSDLAGHQILEFWDRLCTGLRARKVSLNDTSHKRGMELRLLHGIAYNVTWFGRWGYKFSRGSFGINEPIYQRALEAIRGMPLCLLLHHIATSNQDIPIILSRYQTLSDHSLLTIGDLFHSMLELKSCLPRETCINSYNSTGFLVETNCRWSTKRVEMATRVIVEALKRAELRWVSRQEVRDAARAYIGDTGLLDFVLKSLGNHIVGNYLVRRSLNPVTKVLEYCLQDISNVFTSHDHQGLIMNDNPKAKARYKITRVQLMKDMVYLYKYIVKDPKPTPSTGLFSAIQVAARIILDAKYLMKEYFGELPFQVELGLEGKLNLYCTIMLRNNEGLDENLRAAVQPYECISMKGNATIDELKLEVERNFKDIYWGLRNLVVESILNLNAKGTDMVFRVIEVGHKLVLEGCNNDTGEIFEGYNSNNFIVDCSCGTKDDDGERMVSCDICEVWQHTRCVQISDDEEIPQIFLCKRCEQGIVLFPSCHSFRNFFSFFQCTKKYIYKFPYIMWQKFPSDNLHVIIW
ncbi:PHD finger protein family [Quillaja saponaria]|uniref:PHD finger protein family n=1 Tax=Quillaja saponaria TaxID=32244 RepID=A0AAD7QL58_QUISA|nr:PHD finger protein family [Quillaja saponaria]